MKTLEPTPDTDRRKPARCTIAGRTAQTPSAVVDAGCGVGDSGARDD